MATTIDITPLAGHAVVPTQLGVGAGTGYDAIDLRRLVQVGRREGVHIDTGWTVGEHTPNNLSVDIHSNGSLATVEGDSIVGQGNYTVAPHSTDANLTFTTPHATLPRIDQILLRVYDDSHDGLGLNKPTLEVLAGTATAGATLDNRSGAAALPNTAMLLADVLVPATATTLTNSQIRDRRDSAITDEQAGDFIFTAASSRIGCLPCDGSAVNRLTYAKLFSKIGTTHGAGDGSLTFNLPDMRRRSPMGSGSGMSNGQHYGEETHTLSVGELAAHNHGAVTGVESNGHNHQVVGDTAWTDPFPNKQVPVTALDGKTWGGFSAGAGGIVVAAPQGGSGVSTGYINHAHHLDFPSADRSGTHTHGVGWDGSSVGHNTIHPVTVGNYFVKF